MDNSRSINSAREQLFGSRDPTAGAVFVAMPTEQVMANIVPLFELLGPGDRIIWVTTHQARENGWLMRSAELVRGRYPEMRQNTLVPVPEVFGEWGQLQGEFEEMLESDRPVLVANGGTKLMGYALSAAFVAAGHSTFPVIYNAARPAGLIIQPSGHSGTTHRLGYGHASAVTLDEVLAARGFVRVSDNKTQLIWSAQSRPRSNLGPEQDPFGSDPETTVSLHRQAYIYHNRERMRANRVIPSFEKSQFNGQELSRLRRAAKQVPRGKISDAHLSILYNTIRKVGLDALGRYGREADRDLNGDAASPAADLPMRFENAVAARVVAWADMRFSDTWAPRVSEIWSNVRVAETQNPTTDNAELDVLIVFRSGAAVHLECKTSLASCHIPEGNMAVS